MSKSEKVTTTAKVMSKKETGRYLAEVGKRQEQEERRARFRMRLAYYGWNHGMVTIVGASAVLITILLLLPDSWMLTVPGLIALIFAFAILYLVLVKLDYPSPFPEAFRRAKPMFWQYVITDLWKKYHLIIGTTRVPEEVARKAEEIRFDARMMTPTQLEVEKSDLLALKSDVIVPVAASAITIVTSTLAFLSTFLSSNLSWLWVLLPACAGACFAYKRLQKWYLNRREIPLRVVMFHIDATEENGQKRVWSDG